MGVTIPRQVALYPRKLTEYRLYSSFCTLAVKCTPWSEVGLCEIVPTP